MAKRVVKKVPVTHKQQGNATGASPSKLVLDSVTTDEIIENCKRVFDIETKKIMARSMTSDAKSTDHASIAALTRMLKAVLEINADCRAAIMTSREAAALSDEQLANEISKLLGKRQQADK